MTPTALATRQAAGPADAPAPPLVSWLVCTHVFNAQLLEALGSCLNQTFDDHETVVVANGARCGEVADAIRQRFAAQPSVRVVETPITHLTFSLSLGLHHARGTWIARMDGDDVAYPDRLAQQVAHVRQHPETTVVGSAYEVIDQQGVVLRRVTLPLSDAAIRRRLLRGNPFCHPAVMFRRSAVMSLGGYLGSVYAQDYDLWVRLSLEPGTVFANLPQACVGYRAAPVGTARRARWSYAAMAGAQFRTFVGTGRWRWGVAAAISALKAAIRSR